MKILSTNVGRPAEHQFEGKSIQTSMIRHSISEIKISKTQVIGDEFLSPNMHGTPDTVVYAYGADQYLAWEKILNRKMPWGIFGENLTLDTLDDSHFKIDDTYQVGTAVLQVTGPRYPCTRLNFVLQKTDMRETFRDQKRPGVYFRVIQEGSTKPGDELKLLNRTQEQISNQDIFDSLRAAELNLPKPSFVDSVLAHPGLLPNWRTRIEKTYLANLEK